MAVLKHLYRDLGDKVWGVYGFHDGFNETENWFDECYMGLNQAQIVVGIENHRTGLPWKLFMANPEMQPMLDAIGFEPDPTSEETVSLRPTGARPRIEFALLLVALGDGIRNRVVAAVRNAHVHAADAGAFLHFAGAAVQMAERRTLAIADDLDVAPADAASPTGAERFEHRLFRGPATGIVLDRGLAAAAVFDLRGGEHPRDEDVLVPLDHVGDPRAFHDVGADAKNRHGREARGQRSEISGVGVVGHDEFLCARTFVERAPCRPHRPRSAMHPTHHSAMRPVDRLVPQVLRR